MRSPIRSMVVNTTGTKRNYLMSSRAPFALAPAGQPGCVKIFQFDILSALDENEAGALIMDKFNRLIDIKYEVDPRFTVAVAEGNMSLVSPMIAARYTRPAIRTETVKPLEEKKPAATVEALKAEVVPPPAVEKPALVEEKIAVPTVAEERELPVGVSVVDSAPIENKPNLPDGVVVLAASVPEPETVTISGQADIFATANEPVKKVQNAPAPAHRAKPAPKASGIKKVS